MTISKMYGTAVIFLNIFVPDPGKSKNPRSSPLFPLPKQKKRS